MIAGIAAVGCCALQVPAVATAASATAKKAAQTGPVYIGGQFTSVNGTKVNNFAEIDTTTGNVVSGFDDHVGGGHIDTLLVVNGHLLVGGTFTTIGGTTTNPYYASVSPITGKDDGFLTWASPATTCSTT